MAIQSEKPTRAALRRTMSSSTSKFSIRILSTRRGHVGVDLQERRRRRAQLLQALVDRLEQVARQVLLDLMSVSRMIRNRCASTTSTSGKQLVQVEPDDVFEERERAVGIGRQPARSAAACRGS